MSGLRVSFDQTIVVLNEVFKTLDGLNNALALEAVELGEVCKDPLVFLQAMVPLQPNKRISLREWAYLCTVLNWDSPVAAKTEEDFHSFLDSFVYATLVEKADDGTAVPSPSTPSTGTVGPSEPASMGLPDGENTIASSSSVVGLASGGGEASQ